MGDEENALPSSKKRVAGRQISKDNPESDDDSPEGEMGTFKRASEEVMATRRIVKIRRSIQPPQTSSSNPFAGICLVPPSNSSASAPDTTNEPETSSVSKAKQINTDVNTEKTVEDNGTEIIASSNDLEGKEEITSKTDDVTEISSAKTDSGVKENEVAEISETVDNKAGQENTDEENKNDQSERDKEETGKRAGEETDKRAGEETDKRAGEETAKEVEENSGKEEKENDEKDTTVSATPFSSFGQLSGNQNAFTGLAGTGFSKSFGFGSFSSEGSTFGATSGSLFSFGTSSVTNGSSSSVMLNSSAEATKSAKLSMQEVPVETGEENEKAVFTADAIIYEYSDGGWKERGKGELKVNVSLSGVEKARLVMRAKGNYRLILNASIYPDMNLTNMDKKGITFACVNSAGEAKEGLSTFALKFKDISIVEEFREMVAAHKGKKDHSEVQDDPPEISAC